MFANFSPFPVLTTSRLHLRQLAPSDDWDNFNLRSDDLVNKYLADFRHVSIEQTRLFIDKILTGQLNNEWIFWVMTLKASGQFIGTICLWNLSAKQNKAETGYTLHPNFQGQGYMKEALDAVIDYGFNTMHLQTIEAYTHRDNHKSASLLTNCKFKRDTSRVVNDGSKNIIFILHHETIPAN